MPPDESTKDAGMPASNRTIEIVTLLRRLQPTLHNRHPPSEILMLCRERPQCTFCFEGVLVLRFDVFAEGVYSLGDLLVAAVDFLLQFSNRLSISLNCAPMASKPSSMVVSDVLNLCSRVLDFAAHVLHLAPEFVNAIIDPPLDSAEIGG